MSKPKAIFKYFSEERMDVLKNGLIRFTQPNEFNDPFEAYPYFKSMGPHDSIDKKVETFDSAPDYYEDILKETLEKDNRFQSMPPHLQIIMKALAEKKLKELKPQMTSKIKNIFLSAMKLEGVAKPFMIKIILYSISQTIGILCFTEKKDNLLMWSHYANSHKGFVLEFFPDHLFFDKRKHDFQLAEHLKKVRYTIKRPEFTFFDDSFSKNEMSDNWIKNFIWVKSQHWEYEQEWRMISTFRESDKSIKNGDNTIYLFSLPPKAIKSIYLGCKMPDKIKAEFIKLIQGEENFKHIEVWEALPDEKEYKLGFKKLKI